MSPPAAAPPAREWRRRLSPLLPWLLLCGGLVAVQWSLHGWLYAASDDPYIYLGYVKGALGESGALFSYNAGEHSAGTTGLLYYYLLLAVCGALHAALPFVPLPEVLLLGLWLLNALLFVLAGAVYLAAASRLGLRDGRVVELALFALFCANPKFLWGAFSGLENPLSALLVLLLFERLLARAPPWHTALAAAALVATRPETLTLAWAAPLAGARAGGPHARAPFASASATFVVALALLFVPCRLATGQWLPSSLGARVDLAPLADPSDLLGALSGVLRQEAYWSSEWLLYAWASLALSTLVVRRRRGALVGMSLVVLAFYLVRAALGLARFDVEDRYVSYLWPLHALVFAAAGAALAPRLAARRLRAASVRLAALLLAGLLCVSLADFFRRFERHVDLVDEVVVKPSRWMHAKLPAGSRICMEPAGAIRVFTDFYLVDATGLTTTHRSSYRGDYPSFLDAHGVDYVFDRDEPAAVLAQRGLGRPLVTWAPGLEFGDIRLWEVGPPRNAVLVGVVSGPSSEPAAAAVFDNVATATARPGDAWRAGAPGWLVASLAAPVPIDRVEVVVRHAGAGAPAELRVEGRDDGARVALAAAKASERVPVPGLSVRSFALASPRELDGLRVEASGPTEIVEISAARGETRYWWLDVRQAAGSALARPPRPTLPATGTSRQTK